MADTSDRTISFLGLPQELKDEIYRHHYIPSELTSGPLRGYTEVPSKALLRTCEAISAEAASYHYRGLEEALLSNQVCIELGKSFDGKVQHAGWTRTSPEHFDIWVRNGRDTNSEVAWLMDKVCIWPVTSGGSLGEKKYEQLQNVYSQIIALSRLLYKWREIFGEEELTAPIWRRLLCVQTRIRETNRIIELGSTDGHKETRVMSSWAEHGGGVGSVLPRRSELSLTMRLKE